MSTQTSPTPPTRRERLLRAALEEFAALGPAGARTDSIAASAGVNKQLITYYFGGKMGLWKEMLRWSYGREGKLDHRVPGRQYLLDFFRRVVTDPRWSRLLQWEALAGEPIEDEHRQARYRALVDWVVEDQRAGRLSSAFDPDLLFLTLLAVAEYPAAYPQLTRLITGQQSDDPVFVRRFEKHLRRLSKILSGTSDLSEEGGDHPRASKGSDSASRRPAQRRGARSESKR